MDNSILGPKDLRDSLVNIVIPTGTIKLSQQKLLDLRVFVPVFAAQRKMSDSMSSDDEDDDFYYEEEEGDIDSAVVDQFDSLVSMLLYMYQIISHFITLSQ